MRMERLRHVAAFVLVALAGLPMAAAAQHMQVLPPKDMTVDAKVRRQVIDGTLHQLDSLYVYPEVARQMSQAIRGRVKRGEYDRMTSAVELADSLTRHLQAVSHDRHLTIWYSDQPIPAELDESKLSPEERVKFLPLGPDRNYGFEKVERLPGNVGYLNLRGFMEAPEAAEIAAAAMTFLARTDALIIDLRQNIGGDPVMVGRLCTYLFERGQRLHLNDLYYRAANRTDENWTTPDLPGPRFAGKDVYLLTSHFTFSGAEEFAYDLKNLQRATIVGETTGGGAHPIGLAKVSEHFAVRVPTGRAINPVTHDDWEGKGVSPDVSVPADSALKTAHLMALKKLDERATEPERKAMLKMAIDRVESGATGPAMMVRRPQ